MMRKAFIAAVCIGTAFIASCHRFQNAQGRPAQPGSTSSEAAPANGFVWPAGKRVAVSLTFDDARLSQADVGIPLLDDYGVKATFYVSPSNVTKRLPAWRAAAAAGHEIGNHSMRHPCTGNFPWAREKALENYTLEEMADELDRAGAEIFELLGVRPVTFAYPCGQKFVGRGEKVRSYVPLVASRFLAGRGWRDEGANDPAFCDPEQLMAMELDGLTFEQLRALVEAAREKGFWLVLCGHEIGAGGRQTTRADTLEAFCEYARDPNNGLWVNTVANVTRYVVERRLHAD